ncbi:MAG: PQQ-binding-like beta-propeller repeat protein [Candidatus Marinimicrobia bacterium]|nr:PQQ-binding-like beta-propeller repeat protein [Candidatus Neomarinimicrobiota bacterium]
MVCLKRLLLITQSMLTLCWAQAADLPTIKFAWLTDTHVGSPTGAADLRIVVNDIQSNDSISFVIVSGDISELDVGENLTLAKTILDSLNRPYYIIPGNHDTKWTSSGGGLFEQLWGADRFNVEIGEFRFIGHHQGPLLRMGAGYIDPDDITWIDSILQAMPDPRQKVFMVMHYPLDPAIDNWYALRDVIRPFNIQAIFHGHGHATRVTSYAGIPGVMSRSILRRGLQPTGYSIVDIEDDLAKFFERIPLTDSLRMWHKLRLGDIDTRDSIGLPYPDYSENDSSGVEELWQISTGSLITSAPTVYKSKVVIGTIAGEVLALSLNSGEKEWSWQAEAAIHSTPAVKGSRLVIGSVDSSITCLSLKDGKLLWRTHTSDPVLGSPLIHGRKVFIGSGDGIFRALKLKTGEVEWSYSDINGYIETKPILVNNKIMFGAWDGSFYALDAKNGRLKWKWSQGKPGLLLSPAACWPVATKETVFIVAPDRSMTAIKIATGETLWRKVGHRVRESIGISEDGKTVFARTMQDTVLAVDSQAEQFKLKWIKHIGFGYDIAPNSLIEKEGNLFFSTDDGRVYCLDSSTGKILWHHRISSGLINTLYPIDANTVVCTGTDGKVTLLKFRES